MKRLTLRYGVLGSLVGALLLFAHELKAADHLDSATTLAPLPLADINDVYAWMTPDGQKVNLVMTISPGDNGTRHFSPGVQYVFHVTSKAGLGVGQAGGTETRIICTFASDLAAKCWIGDNPVKDYVEGDPTSIEGITSFDAKVRMFAGRRSDPFFFNLQGFRDAVAAVKATGGITLDAAGCPNNVDATAAAALRAKVQQAAQATATAPCAIDNADCFKHLKVLAIVMQVDKSLLLDAGQTTVGVWASTHMGTP